MTKPCNRTAAGLDSTQSVAGRPSAPTPTREDAKGYTRIARAPGTAGVARTGGALST